MVKHTKNTIRKSNKSSKLLDFKAKHEFRKPDLKIT